MKNIVVNGEQAEDIMPYIYEITFDDVYDDGLAVGRGVFERIEAERN